MNTENLIELFKFSPILSTILIIASMFFMIVLWRGWPDFGNYEEEEENVDFLDDETEEKKYSVQFRQIGINLNPKGLPESIDFKVLIKKKEEYKNNEMHNV